MRGGVGEREGRKEVAVSRGARRPQPRPSSRGQAHQFMALEAEAGLAPVAVAAVDAPNAPLVDAEPTVRLVGGTERLPQLYGSALQPQN